MGRLISECSHVVAEGSRKCCPSGTSEPHMLANQLRVTAQIQGSFYLVVKLVRSRVQERPGMPSCPVLTALTPQQKLSWFPPDKNNSLTQSPALRPLLPGTRSVQSHQSPILACRQSQDCLPLLPALVRTDAGYVPGRTFQVPGAPKWDRC